MTILDHEPYLGSFGIALDAIAKDPASPITDPAGIAALRKCRAVDELLEACKVALKYLQANRPKGNIRDNFSALNEHENGVCKPLWAAIDKAERGEA